MNVNEKLEAVHQRLINRKWHLMASNGAKTWFNYANIENGIGAVVEIEGDNVMLYWVFSPYGMIEIKSLSFSMPNSNSRTALTQMIDCRNALQDAELCK